MTDMHNSQVRSPKVAKVASVSEDNQTVIINQGSVDGVAIGQRFLIFSIGQEIKDPDSGESLGNLEVVKGTGKVMHVQQRIATISSDMKGAPSRTIIRSRPATSLWSVISGFGEQQVEEYLPAAAVSFDSPKVGDFAKPI
jgi:hypothetical protein